MEGRENWVQWKKEGQKIGSKISTYLLMMSAILTLFSLFLKLVGILFWLFLFAVCIFA